MHWYTGQWQAHTLHQIDSSTMGTHQLHLAWFTYNCCTESYTPPPVGLTPIPHLPGITLYLVCKFQSFFSFWIACDTPVPNIEEDTKVQVARHNQPNIYIHENRQQNTPIQYPRRREKPIWQATTTTAVLTIQLLYGIFTTSKHSTNTSTACDTPSIKVLK